MEIINDYETVFILTPVLSDEQMKDTVEKFMNILKEGEAEIVHRDDWGLRKLAYPIQKKNSGFYTVVEFRSAPTLIQTLETEYRRDERVMRHLVIALDKHAVAYNKRRREKLANQVPTQEKEEAKS
ncbi:MAG: 30S ribosomal protein S6 [Microscillaceae bacterium]|nr:30S ribosomal protein S6 [Microscillaceae bacterium]